MRKHIEFLTLAVIKQKQPFDAMKEVYVLRVDKGQSIVLLPNLFELRLNECLSFERELLQ